ncbi:multicopper oxidase family protein [Couchioplanes azureus]|uniref:multicopper oxidase family protein n=1 Tax=Couchioplanes caeruleus TaxID=56438 RepID=UPI001670705B|nr:multicopper oxidase family protein [Couchioplanes caeruleus]
MSPSRRTVIGGVLGGAAAAALPFVAFRDQPGKKVHATPDPGFTRIANQAALPAQFSLPLKFPPVLRPTRTDGTTDYYSVTAREADLTILPGMSTRVFSYEGSFPGPTIEARSGRRVVVTTTNQLPVPTVTHLHGGHTPADSDGYATDLILPVGGWPVAPSHRGHAGHGATMSGDVRQGTRDYVYPNRQRAATLWYHDHRMDFTGPQVWRGLAGFYIVRDGVDDALPLPDGDRELPLMIMDRSFDANGQFTYPSADPTLHEPGLTVNPNGVQGDVILVNGVPWPFHEVKQVKYRLRLLNASNSRRYRVSLSPDPSGDGEPFTQIGSDGGLLAAPQPMSSIYMVPGERFDVIVDFSKYAAGTKVVMTNSLGDGSTKQIMQFRVTGPASDGSQIPAQLSTVERLDPARAVRTRTFNLLSTRRDGKEVHVINDRMFSTDHIMADPRLGTLEIWEFRSSTHHPVHVHLNPFQVIGRGGGLEPEDAGWKDTVRLTPNNTVRVVTRFDDYTGKFMLHCHNLEHEDMAMMANFQVS